MHLMFELRDEICALSVKSICCFCLYPFAYLMCLCVSLVKGLQLISMECALAPYRGKGDSNYSVASN